MKTTFVRFAGIIALLGIAATASANVKLTPSENHTMYGVGLCVDQIPVSMATLTIPLSYFAYERQFAKPTNLLRGGLEIGVFGFYGILPIPEVGTNFYVFGEDRTFQIKIGCNGFYDVFVGGHGGLAVKTGLIANNRFDFDIMVVPPGLATDSRRSYQEALGLESKETADAYYAEHHYHIKLPYFGLLVGLRF
ncbi:MAG TPA: hypothetical protein VLX68_03950 [Chitinivibrionales bacterium]|nr:hypothetical protein [Chitinivibrionales bacterium]